MTGRTKGMSTLVVRTTAGSIMLLLIAAARQNRRVSAMPSMATPSGWRAMNRSKHLPPATIPSASEAAREAVETQTDREIAQYCSVRYRPIADISQGPAFDPKLLIGRLGPSGKAAAKQNSNLDEA